MAARPAPPALSPAKRQREKLIIWNSCGKYAQESLSGTVTLNLAFSDKTQSRILRGLPPGEWTDVSIPLRPYTGKTIVRIMVRADRRFAPGTYEARLDDIRIVTLR